MNGENIQLLLKCHTSINSNVVAISQNEKRLV